MLTTRKTRSQTLPIVLRRMREASELTMRQVGAMIGISHVAISQFENGKLNLPDYRIEQLVNAYGYSKADFAKILGHKPTTSPKDDCHSMIDRLSDEKLSAVREILRHLHSSSELRGENQ